jgi:hypothetical protein
MIEPFRRSKRAVLREQEDGLPVLAGDLHG